MAKLVLPQADGKGRRDVILAALGRGHAQDQHVLGQPALVAAHGGRDAQREAFLAQQRVAAVARAEAPDLARLGVVDDVLGGIAGPGHVGLAVRQRLAHRMDAGHEVAVGAQHVIDLLAHARHDAHVDDHIGAVGQFDANVRDVRAQRAHRERHHVQRAAAHGAVEQAVERGAHLGGIGPVVGGAGVLGAVGTDEGAVLDAGHVGRVGTGQERIRPFGGFRRRMVPDCTICSQRRSYSCCEPSHQTTRSGLASATTRATQSISPRCFT